MKKVVIILAVIVAVIGAVLYGFYWYLTQGPDLSPYMHLREPQISAKPAQNMLVVTAKGDPNVVGGPAFEALFSTYFRMPGVPKSFGGITPRARWPLSADTPMSEWVGRYALPVPDSIDTIPAGDHPAGLSVALEQWSYGEVAEILHFGPYDQEQPTIERLKGFVRSQGYEITGEHEEEYLKGPTLFGKGDPQAYVTIIRYEVAPVDSGR